MSSGYAPCSCDEALALRRELAETKELLATAAAELDRRDEHLAHLRGLLRELRSNVNTGRIGLAVYQIDAALKEIRNGI